MVCSWLILAMIPAGGIGAATGTPGPTKAATPATERSPVKGGLPNVQPGTLPEINITKLPWDPDGKRVVARVNGSRITEGMLRAELQRATSQGIVGHVQLPGAAQGGMLEPVLANLVQSRLILGFARQNHIKVADEEIDAWIRSQNARMPPGRKLEDFAVQAGETKDELREEVEVRLLHDRVADRIGAHLQPATPERLAEFMKSHPSVATTTTIRASHIVIGCKADATSETVNSAHGLAQSIEAEIQSGLDFTSAALRYSQDAATRAQGGDLGYFRQGRMYPEFDKVAFNLEPGQLSPIVRSPVGFHIIQVIDKRPDNAQELYMLTEKKKAFTEWHTRALKAAKIERFL